MAETTQQSEAIPASYPTAPSGLSTAAAALDASMVWQRIESYVAHRWTARAVIWIVEGAGDWCAPLTPATVSATETWQNYAWATATLNPTAYGGYVLPGDGPYRFTASVGSGTPPDAVLNAYRRLAEYMAEDTGTFSGATSESSDIGPVTLSVTRNQAWMARALQNSGAADLLRPYRRASNVAV